jgi:RNA polymerase sigma factor (TIGR02999 family)
VSTVDQGTGWLFVKSPALLFTRDDLVALMQPDDSKDPLYEALIAETRQGSAAAQSLLELLYEELRGLARARVGQLPPGQTLQATALVHEVWMRLSDKQVDGFAGRRHFFAAASRAMRDILVEQARRKHSAKRGGGDRSHRIDESEVVDEAQLEFSIQREELLTLDGILDQFEAAYPRQAQVVMLRWFCGLSQSEVAALLEVVERTVERDWRFAKAWLFDRLHDSGGGPSDDG